MGKSAQVCSMAIESLLCGHDFARLWTYTVPSVLPPRTTAKLWSLAQRDLVRGLRYQAVRVFELHPGGHGLHVHAVTPYWYPVDRVREITTRHGFGRINVISIPSSRAGYVCKYLRKQRWRLYPELRGMRLWACVGRSSDWRGVSCKNVVYDSPSTRTFRALYTFLDATDRASFRTLKRLSQLCDLFNAGMVDIDVENPLSPFPRIVARPRPSFRCPSPHISIGGFES